MDTSHFQRARSPEAKRQREDAILAAARSLGAERGIRQITLTDIADKVGMHKSALLRYFETREQIFLRLTAEGWREWTAALRARLDRIGSPTAKTVASAFSTTLADCDIETFCTGGPGGSKQNTTKSGVRIRHREGASPARTPLCPGHRLLVHLLDGGGERQADREDELVLGMRELGEPLPEQVVTQVRRPAPSRRGDQAPRQAVGRGHAGCASAPGATAWPICRCIAATSRRASAAPSAVSR